MFFILTLVSLVSTAFSYGKTACDDKGKYPVSLSLHGHCFFEPPDYLDQINEGLENARYGFVLTKARDICRNHFNSTILRYDLRNTNNDSITKTLRKFMETNMRFRLPVVDCYTESTEDNPHDLDCTRPSEQVDKWKDQSMLFIFGSYDGVKNFPNGGRVGNERYWGFGVPTGLICHQPPGSVPCPECPTTIRPLAPYPTRSGATSSSVTFNVHNCMMAIAALAWVKA